MSRHPKHCMIVLLLCCAFLNLTLADLKDDVCGNIKPNVNPEDEFNFEDIFRVQIEMVTESGFRLFSYADMYHNPDYKTTMLMTTEYNVATKLFFLYDTNECLTFDLDKNRPTCEVQNLLDVVSDSPFHPLELAPGELPKVSQIFRLSGSSGLGGDIQLQRSAKDVTFRSLTAKEYVSCQKITFNKEEVVAKVTHIITDTKITETEKGSMPLQVKFDGKYLTGTAKGQDVHFTNNFFHYQTLVDSVMETPENIICEGRKTAHDFPKLPPQISFGQETHFPDRTKKIETTETVYDKELNYVEESYFNNKGTRGASRLDDFDTGLSYQINWESYSCKVSKISEAPAALNDFMREADGTIEMVTPEHFFHRDGVDFHYGGQKRFQHILTDVWNGKDPKTGHIYAWFFLLNVEHTINDYAKINKDGPYRIPYKRMIWEKETSEPTSTYFYNVDFTTPVYNELISECFEGNSKNIFIHLQGLQIEQLEKDEMAILRRMRNDIAKALQMSRSRIVDPFITFYEDVAVASLHILGRPNVDGDQVKTDQHFLEPTVEEAVSTLEEKLKKGSLKFNFGTAGSPIKIKGKIIDSPSQNYSKQEAKTAGYSTGALVGFAFGMTILGAVIGGVGRFWFFVKKA